MQIATIIERRRRALLDLWISDAFFQVFVDGEPMLRNAQPLPSDAVVEPLGLRRRGNVLVVPASGDRDRTASVWVRVDRDSHYSGYQGAYLAFVNDVYGTAFTLQDLSGGGYQVDHLLNKNSVEAEVGFVRVEAVSQKVNQAWGGFYESEVSGSARPGRKMRWAIASKLAEQLPPAKADYAAGLERLIRFWVARGFPREQVAFGLALDLNPVFGLPPPANVAPTTRWL